MGAQRATRRRAVADGIALTGRVITAAAAIMVCVFLSFMLGDQRTIKEFGFGLAFAVFLDALVVRCVLLPAVLQMLGERHLAAAAAGLTPDCRTSTSRGRLRAWRPLPARTGSTDSAYDEPDAAAA